MNGLIIKDLRLLKGQMNFFVLFIIIGCAIAWFSDSPGFAIGYIGFIGSFFTLSTVSYDEFNNGYAFMFTLPVTRKTYVNEKYVFGFLLSIGSIIAGAIPAFLIMMVKGNSEPYEFFYTAFSVLSVVTILLSIMLPIHIKYGSEKSKIALLVPFGLLFAFALIIKALIQALDIDIAPAVDMFAKASPLMIILIVTALALTSIILSIRISYNIMNKKEL